MDYSHDEQPGGSSPWNTSPRQTARPDFGTEPDSPTPQRPAHHTRMGQHDDDDETLAPSEARPYSSEEQPNYSQTTLSDGRANNGAQHPPQNQQRHPQQQQAPQSQQQYPEGAQGTPIPSRYQPALRQNQQQNAPRYKLQAKITGIEGTGKKDMIVRFDVQTDLPKFRTTQFRDVRRTHAEFRKLADHLISSHPEAMVPAIPSAITSAGAGTEENEARVRASLQRWLNTVCGNDVLMTDDEVIFFVESDFGYSPVLKMKQPATGVRRKYLKQFAPPPDNIPELYEARPVVKLFYLGAMDTGQKVDKIVKSRRGLGLAESEFGVKLAQLNVQETHPGLATAYRKLGRTIQAVGDYHAAQGTAEAATLGDALNYHSDDAFIVKETLTNRHILLRELIQAQSSTRSRLNAADRLRASASVRREKVDEAIAALDEARSHERFLGERTERVSGNLLYEKRRWFDRTATDLKATIREYVMRQIEAERRALATLEVVRPDIRNIDGTGGLSRLGRETHPATRRSQMASSQGPRGDAWSGVQRSRSYLGSPTGVAEEPAETADGNIGRKRAGSSASKTLRDDDDDDRVDAKNAASRLAQSSF